MNSIREIRKNMGITIRELSNLTEIDESYLSKIERGEANVTEAKLRRIAEALNTPVSALLGEPPARAIAKDNEFDYFIDDDRLTAIVERCLFKQGFYHARPVMYMAKMQSSQSTKWHEYLTRLILLGSNGHCELCGAEAPCLDENKRPYLLTHVVDPNNTTIDPVKNMVALCPNCSAKLASNPSEEDLETIRKAASSHTF